jgi:PPP family 3-phenylpropionic acid transporter
MQTGMYWRLSGFYFCYFLALGTLVPYFPLYLQHRGLDAWDIGVLTSVMIGTKIIAPNVWGWLADRTQRRMAVIRLGCLLAPLCFIGVFGQLDFTGLLLVVFAYSFFWNAVLAQFEAVTLAYLGDRPEQYSRIRLWGSVGFIIAVSACGWIFDRHDVSVFAPLVMIAFLTIFASSWCVPEPPAQAVVHAQQGGGAGFMARVRQKHILVFFLVCFLMVLSHGPYYAFFTLLMEQQGYKRTVTGLLWSVGVAAEVVLFWFMHRLLPRLGLRALLLISVWLTALRWLLLAFLPGWLSVMLFSQCLHAFSFAAFHSVAIESVRRWFSVQQSGKAQALYSAVSFGAGNALGALASGALWITNPALPFLFSAMACILAAWLVLRYYSET